MPAMWDKFRGAVPQKHGRSQHHQQQVPPQHQQQQAYYQQQQYPRTASAYQGGYSYNIQGGPPPPRPPREFVEQQLHNYYHNNEAPPVQQLQEPLAPQAPPPRNPHRNPYRDSGLRPASSIYSQPSPLQTNFSPPPQKRSYTFNDADDISPPSSPEAFSPRDGLPQDISPIDEEPNDMLPQQPSGGHQGFRSNIPSMRRERRQKMDAQANTVRETRSRERLRAPPQSRPPEHSGRGYNGGEVRWDPATGELTSSEKGRPSQVKPAEYAKGLGNSPDRAPRTPVDGQQQQSQTRSASFGERMRRLAQPGFATGGAEKAVTQEPARQPPAGDTDPAAGAFGSDRPGWKGASGRTTIVAPVHDTRDVPPLNIPRRSSKRTGRSPTTSPSVSQAAGMDALMASPPASPHGPETHDTLRQVVPSSQLTPQQPQQRAHTTMTPDPAADYPSPPYSAGDAPLLTVETAGTQHPAPPPHFVQSPASLTPTSAIRRKPMPAQLHQQQDSISSVYSQNDPFHHDQNHYESHNPQLNVVPPPQQQQQQHQDDGWVQPPSRFSVTTYATSTQSPRVSTDGFDAHDAPPVPALPAMGHDEYDAADSAGEAAQPQESVMDRRRPKLRTGARVSPGGSIINNSDDEPIVINLRDAGNWKTGSKKPESVTTHQQKSMSADQPKAPQLSQHPAMRKAVGSGLPNGRPESISSMAGSIYKSLPPAPPEMSAKDRADQLNAQLRALANRRININRSIKQMTELMPTDNIMASSQVLLKREAEARKVKQLQEELDDVKREEYKLGLKLHRAYKRMDSEATFEPTTLWVRRVTG